VFHHHYYDAIARVKCSLSRSDGDSNRFLTSWWFIPHTNHTHRLSELQVTNDTISVSAAGQIMDRQYQGPLDCQESGLVCPWAHSSRPCRTPFSTNMRTRVNPDPNGATGFTVERYFIRPAKCEACVQHDKRDEQWLVFNRHRQKLQAPQNPIWLPTTYSARSLFIHQHLVIFMIASIAKAFR
jgi:hypothetical protein